MKNVLVIILAVALAGCAHTEPETGLAKAVQVPELPVYFDKKAERLPDIADPSFGGIMIDGAETDMKYNDVSIRYNQLVEYYKCIRIAVNEKDKEIKTCTQKILE